MSGVPSREAEILYSQAVCVDANPMYFDQIEHNKLAKEALNYCAVCPVRKQCLMVVKPRESYFDGICGGVIWRNGQRVGAKTVTIVEPDVLDEMAIERLIRGDIDWKEVGIKERREAAWIMYQRGYSYSVLVERTHLFGKSIKKVFARKGA
jgi:hypothetical protein